MSEVYSSGTGTPKFVYNSVKPLLAETKAIIKPNIPPSNNAINQMLLLAVPGRSNI